MDFEKFESAMQKALPPKTEFENPGGGTTTIVGYSNSRVSYRRGKSSISVSLLDLYEAYSAFIDNEVSASDLKSFRPSVFDSSARPAGHSCNCTFLFRALETLGLCGPIQGSGVRGRPFAVKVNGFTR